MDPQAGGNGRSGPLSRTWPQLFKKRRRHSPPRDAAAAAAAAQDTYPPDQQQQLPIPPPPPQQKIPISKTTPVPQNQVVSDNASTISSTGSGSATQADLLASKSNYEWIAEGRHAEMGLHFSTAMATGVMMRRATHRAAEQARRDRMKGAMVDLAEFLLDGEVTFGSGTSCFVVTRGEGEEESAGQRKNINKAKIIEMALEKLKAQDKELEVLRQRVEDCTCTMDTTE